MAKDKKKELTEDERKFVDLQKIAWGEIRQEHLDAQAEPPTKKPEDSPTPNNDDPPKKKPGVVERLFGHLFSFESEES